MQIISAICGGVTDLSFHAVGYAWQVLNCFLTASYSVNFLSVMQCSSELFGLTIIILYRSIALPLLYIGTALVLPLFIDIFVFNSPIDLI